MQVLKEVAAFLVVVIDLVIGVGFIVAAVCVVVVMIGSLFVK